jgi:hypothetical protein
MTTVGVTAVAAPEMVGRCEDEVRAFVVIILRAEFFAEGFGFLFVDIFWLRHSGCHRRYVLLPFYSFCHSC